MNKNKFIKVQGANQHNLKNVSTDIPRNQITVVTGVSGSGKSSLAFDTIYAEGQRRFVESLSSYARQFLERMEKPDVESIEGLPPAVAIEQHPPQKNPRSTVGTSTEIYDHIRLIYGRIGQTYCKISGKLVKKDSPDSAVKDLQKLEEGTKLYVLFRLPDSDSSKLETEIKKYRENGFFRIVMHDSKEIIDLEEQDLKPGLKPKDFYFLVDRIKLKFDDESLSRLADSLETAFEYGHGRISVYDIDKAKYHKFSNIYEDSESGRVYVEPEPKLFSFNNPFGACPKCQGFGRSIGIDKDLVIPNRTLSIERGAIAPFTGKQHSTHLDDLLDLFDQKGIASNIPYSELSEEAQEIIWNGSGRYLGIYNFFQKLEDKNYKVQNRVMLARYRGYTKCDACNGSRLRTSARQVFVGGKNIPELITMPLDKLYEWFKSIKFTESEYTIVKQVYEEIIWRLELLNDIGLEYLTLDRLNHTLSGGESQRINLSTALGSSLVGTLYVLDEPSTGLHPRDTDRLIGILKKLKGIGNTILVVEHDPDVMKEADHIIDVGPNAGIHGGEIIFTGDYKKILKDKKSLTAQYLNGTKTIEIPSIKRKMNAKVISIKGATEHNLSIPKVEIPQNLLTVVTGVSGSGKSTLIHDILYAGVKKFFGTYKGEVGKHEMIEGFEEFDDIEMVDQSPIGRSSRSTPATYLKAFDLIREEFAKTQMAQQMNYKPGYFSFNVAGGRCEVCEGEGYVNIDMQFLPDVKLICETCNGTRYKAEARNIKLEGKSIVDVLNMTVDESIEFFDFNKKIQKKLQVLVDVGLGYLTLGQPSTMLSGGEAQRIKLAQNLEGAGKNKKIFIFDEPTTGLHLDDISKLIKCFDQLVKNGHTVIIIEHNLHIMAFADHIIDLGPEAGVKGGELVDTGTPEEIANRKKSYTGKALAEFFNENN